MAQSRPGDGTRATDGPSPIDRAERIARVERSTNLARGDAVLVGTRAGVVEWADAAWTRLTGFPLEETVEKPITHFLDRAGIERELVAFVAHHFLEGRPCSVALPFDTLDGRCIDVTLEVEPWCDARGEISRFVAVAREADPLPSPTPGLATQPQAAPPCTRPADDATKRPRPNLAHEPERSLSHFVHATVSTILPSLEAAHGLDAFLESDGPILAGLEAREVLAAMLSAAVTLQEEGAWISVVGGATRAGRSHDSLVYPVPNRALAASAAPSRYVEVHDTGPHLDRQALARLRASDDAPATTPREAAWRRAIVRAREAGLALHVDSTPGCGTQGFLVLPTPPE